MRLESRLFRQSIRTLPTKPTSLTALINQIPNWYSKVPRHINSEERGVFQSKSHVCFLLFLTVVAFFFFLI